MASQSLFEDCQTLIEKGHESWESYFTKWESFAKYEEDIPESELFNEPKKKTKSLGKKKVKNKSNSKATVLPLIKYKKNEIRCKNLIKRKRKEREINEEVNIKEDYIEDNTENIVEDVDNVNLEAILKSVFTDILKTRSNEFQMFTILSHTISGDVRSCSQIFHCQQKSHFSDISNPFRFGCNLDISSISPSRSNYMGNFTRRWNLFESKLEPIVGIEEQIRYSGLTYTFPKFSQIHQNNLNQQLLFPLSGNPSLRPTKITLPLRNECPALPSSLRQTDTKFKSLECDSGLKFPNSVSRKINKEYFIKRNFLKMNITQDGKRFRNLCLRKRTNSVTLSMENSNFITPERKPPERKCFSENVSQRKRTRPSKLFFGNEDEDSESDDETEKQTPIIHCRKKLKTQTISEIVQSDSDDCESIFDRVRT